MISLFSIIAPSCPDKRSRWPRQITRHSTYRSQSVVVHYRWHPLHGERLRVQQRSARRGEQIVHLEVRADVSWEIPVWMCDASVCAAMSVGPPQISIDALNELRGVLTNHSRDHGSSDPSKEEESRDDRTTTKTARARAQPRRSLTTGSAKITRTGPGTGRPASGGARRGRQ